MNADPPLFTLWYDFSFWLLQKTGKFPKNSRFTFVHRIDNLALDILSGIVEARYSARKSDILRQADLHLELLRVLLRMTKDLALLDNRGYEHASRRIAEAGKMMGGWRKQRDKVES